MLPRRAFISATALSATGIAIPFVFAQTRPEKSRIVLAVCDKTALHHLPITLAEQLGFFKAEGLEVDAVDFADERRALQAVLSNTADVCAGNYEQVIGLQARNLFFQTFVLEGRAPQIAMGVSIKTLPSYRQVVELKGRRIGIAAPGSTSHTVANLVLARGGLKGTEVSYVGVGVAAGALSALRSGQLDAISNSDPVMTMLEQKGDVRLIGETRTLKGTQQVFGGPMPSACLHAPAEFIQRRPKTCQALTNAIVRSLKWLQTAGPGDIIKTVPETYLLGDRALYLAAFDKVRESIAVDGLLPSEGPLTALNAIASLDASVKAEKIDLARTFINDFAQRAKEKFGT